MIWLLTEQPDSSSNAGTLGVAQVCRTDLSEHCTAAPKPHERCAGGNGGFGQITLFAGRDAFAYAAALAPQAGVNVVGSQDANPMLASPFTKPGWLLAVNVLAFFDSTGKHRS